MIYTNQMPDPLYLVSDLLPSNALLVSIPTAHRPNIPFPLNKSILCAAQRRRNRYWVGRSGKLMLESAYIIASKLRLLPEPLELLLREFGGGNGGGNGFWSGFGGRGGFGGWNRGKGKNLLGILLILVGICCCVVGFWLGSGKEWRIDDDVFLGGLGLVLLGLSVEGWKRGARDWILGFSCCGFLVVVSKRGELRAWLTRFERAVRNCTTR